jgi:hypothetical protein
MENFQGNRNATRKRQFLSGNSITLLENAFPYRKSQNLTGKAKNFREFAKPYGSSCFLSGIQKT